ncbi:MAG TPA: hypothetical protein VKR06_04500 [Ktedonosporobacter sp.]|nr:hypothetical protein [Ktedonosporobacter sp.]
MSSIAILDFDGVIADMTLHAQRAQELAKAFALEQDPDTKSETHRRALRDFFYSEQGFFNSTLAELDQPVAGCNKALEQTVKEYDTVIVLTSRPHSMREITLKWFCQYCPGFENIEFIFKESDESTLKTAIWKAQIVTFFATRYNTILFIDDDERNRMAVESMLADNHNVTITVKAYLE